MISQEITYRPVEIVTLRWIFLHYYGQNVSSSMNMLTKYINVLKLIGRHLSYSLKKFWEKSFCPSLFSSLRSQLCSWQKVAAIFEAIFKRETSLRQILNVWSLNLQCSNMEEVCFSCSSVIQCVVCSGRYLNYITDGLYLSLWI